MCLAQKTGGVEKPQSSVSITVLSSPFCPTGSGMSRLLKLMFRFCCHLLGCRLWRLEWYLLWYALSSPSASLLRCKYFCSQAKHLPVLNFLVDNVPRYTAFAISAANILRSALGALFPLAGQLCMINPVLRREIVCWVYGTGRDADSFGVVEILGRG
jgi:hypothetical protein